MEGTITIMAILLLYGTLFAVVGWNMAKKYYTETDESEDDDEQTMDFDY